MQDTLPYLEEENLYQQFVDYMNQGGSALNFQQNITIVTPLMCPDDPLGPKLQTYNGGGGVGNGVTNSQGFSGNIIVCARQRLFESRLNGRQKVLIRRRSMA